MEKTHYRKAFNSPYLSSADIVEPTIFTISHVKLEADKTKKTKDQFNTAYFTDKFIRDGEPLKPMILNATNSRTLRNLTGSAFIDDWQNVPVTIYVDYNVKNRGQTVEGLRISPDKPKTVKPELIPETPAWDRAITAYSKDKSFDLIEKHMTISKTNKNLIIKEAEGE